MDNKLYLRRAREDELGAAMAIIEQGRAYLRQQGIDQWQGAYPDEASIRCDLAQGKGYFLADGERVLAYLCMDFDGEPAYDQISGRWLTDKDARYMVIHRLAFDAQARGKGLSRAVFALAEEACRAGGAASIRVDTDGCNVIMQHVLEKAGYARCGTIWFAGSEKLAYEKIV